MIIQNFTLMGISKDNKVLYQIKGSTTTEHAVEMNKTPMEYLFEHLTPEERSKASRAMMIFSKPTIQEDQLELA